jgi:hypothetical protein
MSGQRSKVGHVAASSWLGIGPGDVQAGPRRPHTPALLGNVVQGQRSGCSTAPTSHGSISEEAVAASLGPKSKWYVGAEEERRTGGTSWRAQGLPLGAPPCGPCGPWGRQGGSCGDAGGLHTGRTRAAAVSGPCQG